MHQPPQASTQTRNCHEQMTLQTSNVKIAAQSGSCLSLTHALDETFAIDYQLMSLKHGSRFTGDNGRLVDRYRPGLVVQQASALAGTWYTVPLPAVALAESLPQAMRSGWGSGGDCTSPRLVPLPPPHTVTLCTAAHLHRLPGSTGSMTHSCYQSRTLLLSATGWYQ